MSLVAPPSPTRAGHTRAAMWKVMIVEDSPEVAALHRRLVDDTPGFRAIHIASDGEAALRALTSLDPGPGDRRPDDAGRRRAHVPA